MKRLTFEGNFCDIAMCRENPCPYDGSCFQKENWERLKAIEDILGDEYDLEQIRTLPCKMGDTLWGIINFNKIGYEVIGNIHDNPELMEGGAFE